MAYLSLMDTMDRNLASKLSRALSSNMAAYLLAISSSNSNHNNSSNSNSNNKYHLKAAWLERNS